MRGPTATSRLVGRLAERLAVLDGATCHDVPLRPGGQCTGDGRASDERTGDGEPVLRVCAGSGRWTSARGGTTWGEVFVTRRPLARVDAATVRHELVHVGQWRRWGLLLPMLYALSGPDPLRNRFEQQAGLRDGGYLR